MRVHPNVLVSGVGGHSTGTVPDAQPIPVGYSMAGVVHTDAKPKVSGVYFVRSATPRASVGDRTYYNSDENVPTISRSSNSLCRGDDGGSASVSRKSPGSRKGVVIYGR